jgi:ferritin-like metal-binding protein YciE
MAHKELLIAWLNDAYAMEQGLIPILQNHAKDAKNHPMIKNRIEKHVEETRRHAELVKECVERLGSSTSAVKTGFASLTGAIQSVTTGVFSDELVKNALMDYAAENFEIAAYKALVAGAREFGDQRTVDVCQRILEDEMDMADWLNDQLPVVVQTVMREKAREH